MAIKKWLGACFGLCLVMSGAAAGSSAPPTRAEGAMVRVSVQGPVLRGARVYHRAICGRTQARPGVEYCHAHMVTDARGNFKPGKLANASPAAQPGGLGSADLRAAYKIGSLGSGTMTIAIVDAYGYTHAGADLGVYRSQMGLPPCTQANGCFQKVDQNGGTNYPAMDVGWAEETALDLDMVSAICPSCHILLVEANSSYLSDLGTAVNRAVLMGAHVVSNSYGGSEIGTSGADAAYFNHPGVAITVSTGDNGYEVNYPASSPYVTAVGGTSLSRVWSARGWKETAWAGAGSGCSLLYAKPSWQHDALCLNRTVADVSAVADPDTGVAVYAPYDSTHSAWMVFGGTSASAPIIAAIYGIRAGTVNYGQNPYLTTTSLYDVKTGTNGTCGGTYLCTSGSGYDGPTGLGSPKGSAAFGTR